MTRTRIAVLSPSSRLYKTCTDIFSDIGMDHIRSIDKRLVLETNWAQFFFARGFDIPKLVEKGFFDIGISGYDCVVESRSEVTIVARLGRRISRVVLAVRHGSEISHPKDLPDGSIVATEYPNLTLTYLKGFDKCIDILPIKGAAEAYLYSPNVSGIVDLTTTGETLHNNQLKILDTVLTTEPCLIANKSFFTSLHSGSVSEEGIRFIELLKRAGDMWREGRQRSGTVFVAGIVQGSKATGVEDQTYRDRIGAIIKRRFPTTVIVDCELIYPEGGSLKGATAKEAFCQLVERAAISDVIISYLPSASMGSIVEMWEARREGKCVVTITPLKNNWAVLAASTHIVPDLESFEEFVARGGLDSKLNVALHHVTTIG